MDKLYNGKYYLNKKNKFWRDVFLFHIQKVTKNTPTEIQQFQTNPILSSENIKIRDKTEYYKSYFDKGN